MIQFNTLTFNGVADEFDLSAMELIVNNENNKIMEENERRAAENPPLPVLPLYSMETQDELENSYCEVMTLRINEIHERNIQSWRDSKLNEGALYGRTASKKQIESAVDSLKVQHMLV